MIPFVTRSAPTLINRAVDELPVELHLPGYRLCGPGTRLDERKARGERGFELDEACHEHDIAYTTYNDNERRRAADRVLARKAWDRVKALNSGIGERAYATAVTAAMKAKSALGGGLCSGRKRRRRRSGEVVKRRKVAAIRPKEEENDWIGSSTSTTTERLSLIHI